VMCEPRWIVGARSLGWANRYLGVVVATWWASRVGGPGQ